MATPVTPTTTTGAPAAYSPDEVAFAADAAIPEALIFKATTVASTTLEGDRPNVLVPWVRDTPATWTVEGTELERNVPGLDHTAVPVRKLTKMSYISRELWESNDGTNAALLSSGSLRSVVSAADSALMGIKPGEQTPFTGLVNTPERVEGGKIGANLDPLADVIAQIEANDGTPSLIVANPLAWGKLRNLKTADNANTALLGAGTEDQGKKLFGIEVITSSAVPADSLVVIDPGAVASVVGQVKVANSEHLLFNHDAIALRVIWHIGWNVMRPNRIGTVTIGAGA